MTVTVRFAPSPTGNIHIGNARTALVQLAVRAEERRPLRAAVRRHRRRALQAGICRPDPEGSALAGRPPRRHRAPVRALRHLCGSGRAAEGVGCALRLLRNAGGAGASPQGAVVAAAAAGLWARGAEARRRREGRLRGGRPQAALALPAAQFRRRPVRAASAPTSAGTISCAAPRRSTSPPSPIRCWCARTAAISTRCLRSSTTSSSGISHVIRGDDHVTNTGVQIALFRALGAEPPAFGHHNLLTTASGEGLSKRSGALSIASLAESGIEPMAVASLAVLIGTSESVSAVSVDGRPCRALRTCRHLEVGVEVRPGRAHRAQPRR